jgi:zinc protease
MVLANYMLGGSTAARFFKRIREKEGLSYGVNSGFSAPTKDDGGSFQGLALSAPQNTPKVEAAMKDEIARALKEGFSADEVNSSKKSWLDERAVGRTEEHALVGTLIARERYDRTMKFDADLEAKVSALTPEQVSASFRRNLNVSTMTIVKAGDFKKADVYQ